MLRIFLPLAFAIVFVLYVLFHLFIRKDLRKQRQNIYAGITFIAIWALIYGWLLSK